MLLITIVTVLSVVAPLCYAGLSDLLTKSKAYG